VCTQEKKEDAHARTSQHGHAADSLFRSHGCSSHAPCAAAAILSQRFLETEGELGRNFTKAFGRFTDFHQAIAQSAAAAPSADAATPPAASSTAASAADIFQALQRELAAYEYGAQHCKLIQENARVEMKNYEQMEADIGR
jgi:hypothetical protein